MEKSGVSLEKKVKRIAVCAGAVVFFSIGANLAVSWFGLGSFGSILEQNAGSLAFWSAMEEERLAFARYVGTALPEERERFEQSRMETRRRLEELPLITEKRALSGMPVPGPSGICMKITRQSWKSLKKQTGRIRNM